MAVAEGGVGGADEWKIDGVDGVEDSYIPDQTTPSPSY